MGSVSKMKLGLSGVLLALVAAASAKNFGAIKIKGVDQQIYVVGPDWTSDFIVMNGEDGFTLNGGGRIYFANKPSDPLDADMYWQTPDTPTSGCPRMVRRPT